MEQPPCPKPAQPSTQVILCAVDAMLLASSTGSLGEVVNERYDLVSWRWSVKPKLSDSIGLAVSATRGRGRTRFVTCSRVQLWKVWSAL